MDKSCTDLYYPKPLLQLWKNYTEPISPESSESEGNGGFTVLLDDETDGSAHLEEFDPAKIYIMEDFMAEEEIIEKIELGISDSIKTRTAANASGRCRCRRRG